MRKLLILFLLLAAFSAKGQLFEYNNNGIQRLSLSSGTRYQVKQAPFISFRVNGKVIGSPVQEGADKRYETLYTHPSSKSSLPYKITFTFKNTSATDTLTIDNVVPFGENPDHVYITGLGEHRLSRSVVYRPGFGPIGVILPDNAWELGFGVLPLPDGNAVAGLARRKSWEKAQRKRFETVLYPGGEVTYELWYEPFTGNWQEGLRLMLQKHMLFDLEQLDHSLFERPDLAWIRKAYAINLMMAWDKDFYNPRYGIYYLPKTIEKAKSLIGGWDVIGFWPTWPALGLDQRNQWDMFRNLPGGLKELKRITADAHKAGTKIFLCYNPWDESTTATTFAEQMAGMTDMLKATDTDGVVLDTRGSSSAEIQSAGDAAKEGVIMYSEGMAIPKDMPGIISGRVHNALEYPPLLNLNKFIKPDFAIFRVAELAYEPIQREYNLSLFNGHGVEINQFQPGRPEWVDEQYKHLGRILMVLRSNSDVFNYSALTPLVPTLRDSVYVNEWKSETKTLYTIYNANPEGYTGPLFDLNLPDTHHAVNLWTHQAVSVDGGKALVSIDGFDPGDLGTNNEGTVSVVAVFPKVLQVSRKGDELIIESPTGKIALSINGPSYDKKPFELEGGKHSLSLRKTFGWQEGSVVIQYLTDGELKDEVVFELKASDPWLISASSNTAGNNVDPTSVRVPGGMYHYKVDAREGEFIPYPKQAEKDTLMPTFWMDRYPVTNAQYYDFLAATCYRPNDDTNFLRHWPGGKPKKGEEDFPVVYIDIEDARTYAEWKGYRLPTELEWQYAAQAGDPANTWPWGAEMDSTKTSRGDGKPYAVGQFPEGKNTLGIEDLVGNVWQMTNDVYFNGTSEFVILKGGSYFNPTSSWWYVKGGPQPLGWRQMLLRVSPGFERSATVGFRCVVEEKRE
ncbi:MAG: SUMF1/EgtB/PvdO family nonheme iron enzyme [Imperialibacter sp.]|uniref:formylglycine-generating enzyme family protein n=1 Tax=Imperialibacter sp. TaxID=2038411 RepID=UPI0032EB0145